MWQWMYRSPNIKISPFLHTQFPYTNMSMTLAGTLGRVLTHQRISHDLGSNPLSVPRLQPSTVKIAFLVNKGLSALIVFYIKFMFHLQLGAHHRAHRGEVRRVSERRVAGQPQGHARPARALLPLLHLTQRTRVRCLGFSL